jgi:lipopolysaccharide transport system ATP-binding protein
MSDKVIKVKNLSKRYTIGDVHTDLLSEKIGQSFKYLFNKVRRKKDLSPLTYNLSQEKNFWALKDVSFEIEQGEVVGIIGRNGAGKTTLLKILSRITEPTEGTAEIYGRVGSLLEVGTGFHPELSGRENIYLNGLILGMSRAEIKKKFDEIVAFAEVEKFLDTPVKRYSSGMYVRLAFAVAAHLEPEILLVDEVLAVGDASFQKKCLGKMGEVAKKGRTVLFVSHNMGAVERLCKKIVYLNNGEVVSFRDSKDAIAQYINDISESSLVCLRERKDRDGTGQIRATGVELPRVLRTGESAVFEIGYEVFSENEPYNITIALGIDDMANNRLVTYWSKFNNETFNTLSRKGKFICEIPEVFLKTGDYLLNIYIESNGITIDFVPNAYLFRIEYGKFFESGLEPQGRQGYFLQKHHWKIE